MCGIFAVLSTARGSVTPTDALFKSRLASRGPDHYGSHHQTLNETGHDPLVLGLTSSVLALRGSGVVEQPLVHDGGEAVLCWNGEAWRIGGQPVTTNDGKELLNAMVASVDHQDPSGSVRDTLRLIDGPFAFVYFDKRQGRLYFGRDRLGRRSLLIHRSAHALQLSSIAGEPHQGWEEVQADGFYSLEIKSTFDETLASLTRHAWTENDDLVGAQVSLAFLRSGVLLTLAGLQHWKVQRRMLFDSRGWGLEPSFTFGATTSGASLSVPAAPRAECPRASCLWSARCPLSGVVFRRP